MASNLPLKGLDMSARSILSGVDTLPKTINYYCDYYEKKTPMQSR